MQASNLLADSLMLMALGMGTVFVFLTVLVIATSCMSKFAQRFNTSEESTTSTATGVDDKSLLVAVITAAIHQHRSKRK